MSDWDQFVEVDEDNGSVANKTARRRNDGGGARTANRGAPAKVASGTSIQSGEKSSAAGPLSESSSFASASSLAPIPTTAVGREEAGTTRKGVEVPSISSSSASTSSARERSSASNATATPSRGYNTTTNNSSKLLPITVVKMTTASHAAVTSESRGTTTTNNNNKKATSSRPSPRRHIISTAAGDRRFLNDDSGGEEEEEDDDDDDASAKGEEEEEEEEGKAEMEIAGDRDRPTYYDVEEYERGLLHLVKKPSILRNSSNSLSRSGGGGGKSVVTVAPAPSSLSSIVKIASATSTSSAGSNLEGSVTSSSFGSTPRFPDFGSLRHARWRVSMSGITFSEARGEIWKQRLRGALMKQGFRHTRTWRARWVVLAGRMLSYYERPMDEGGSEDGGGAPRGRLELTSETLVTFDDDEEEDSAVSDAARKRDSWGFLVWPKGVVKGASPREIRHMPTAGGEEQQHSVSTNVPPPSSSSSSSSAALTVTKSSNSGGGFSLLNLFAKCGFVEDGGVPENGGGGGHVTASKNNNSKTAASSSRLARLFGDWFSPPDNDNYVWRFRARTERERDEWVRAIRRSVLLIKRVEMGPTLVGVGAVGDHYTLLEEIGRGRFGSVRRAKAKYSGQEFAVRAVNKLGSVRTLEDARALKNEIRVLRRVARQNDHPNICKTYQSYEDPAWVHLVMELLNGGTLAARVRSPDSRLKSIPQVCALMFQLADALREIHSAGIAVCDLNPYNLLYARPESDIVKIAEFGRAVVVFSPVVAGMGPRNPALPPRENGVESRRRGHQEENVESTNFGAEAKTTSSAPTSNRDSNLSVTAAAPYVTTTSPGILGRAGYVAPEVVSHGQYSQACDVWSLGCILYFVMRGGVDPWRTGEGGEEEDTEAGVAKRSTGGIATLDLGGRPWPSGARDLLEKCLGLDRNKRVSASEVAAHRWIVANNYRPTLAISPRNDDDDDDNREKYRARKKRLSPGLLARMRVASIALAFIAVVSRSVRLRNAPPKVAPPPPAIPHLPSSSSSSRHKKSSSSASLLRKGETGKKRSSMEARSTLLALDVCAEKSRSRSYHAGLNDLGSVGSPVSSGGILSTGFTVGASNSGVLRYSSTNMGVSSSVAGRMSEMGSLDGRYATPKVVRPAGPFLIALEQALEREADVLQVSSAIAASRRAKRGEISDEMGVTEGEEEGNGLHRGEVVSPTR